MSRDPANEIVRDRNRDDVIGQGAIKPVRVTQYELTQVWARDVNSQDRDETETFALTAETRPRRDLSPPETRPRRDVAQFETSARRH